MQRHLYGDGKTSAMNAKQQLMWTNTYASDVLTKAVHATGATGNTTGTSKMLTILIAAQAEHTFKRTLANGATNAGEICINLTTLKIQECVLTAEVKSLAMNTSVHVGLPSSITLTTAPDAGWFGKDKSQPRKAHLNPQTP